jgi:hypothetical protein
LKHHKREGRQAAIKDEKLGERKELQQINNKQKNRKNKKRKNI